MAYFDPQKMSAINKTILTTLLTVFGISTLLIVLVVQILLSSSINTAKDMYEEHAIHITQSVNDGLNLMTNMLKFTQQSLGTLNFASNDADISADMILKAMMELSPNVHSAWFGFEKGVYYEDSRYIKTYTRNKETDTFFLANLPDDLETLDDPEIAPWYAVPLLTRKAYFDNIDLYENGDSEKSVYIATISVPIISHDTIIGVCGVDITYQGMFALFSGQDEFMKRNVLLLSNDLTIVSATDQELIFKKLSDFPFTDIDVLENVITQKTEFLEEIMSPFSGTRSLVSLRPIEIDIGTINHYLFMYIDTPLNVLHDEATKIIFFVTSSCVISMLLIVVLIFISLNTLMRPIRALTRRAQQITENSLDLNNVSRDVDDNLKDKNEIAVLERAFMKMVNTQNENLIIVERRVEERTHQLKLMSEEAEAAKARAEEAGEAKTQFLANMSHEIRTPMNAILGMSELLLSENLSNHQHQYAKDIQISAMSLLNIINDILDFSKIQSGKFCLLPVHYDFAALIENINSTARFLVKNKNIVYKSVIFNEVPKCLYGDDVRLRQVLLNVLGNAIKFTEEGYVRLSICINEGNIRFDIEDTGMGIQAKDIPTLFDAFTQADKHLNQTKKGTGLGLSITKTLLEMMGGKITVESLYTRGSIFHIIIPKVIGDESKIPQVVQDEKVIYAPDANILVVDDNTVNLNVSRGLLQLSQITADTAISGAEAIEMISKKQYDIVFMDHMMPEMDGIQATEIIRGKGITVPIIALSANAIAGIKEKFLASGMNDFLTKPINRVALKKVLENWIPAEKIIIPEEQIQAEDETEDLSEFWRKIEQIQEISVHAGLDRVSGQRDIYEGSLKLMLKEIEKCNKNLIDFLAAGDMHNFCIEVHSMKGSLANIGAMELSAKARDLEMASDKKNAGYCSKNLPPFLEELLGIYSKLKDAFNEKGQDHGPLEIPPEAVQFLDKLKIAIDEMDFVQINKEMENLDAVQADEALKYEIEQIKDAVLIMDYKCALEVIQKLHSA